MQCIIQKTAVWFGLSNDSNGSKNETAVDPPAQPDIPLGEITYQNQSMVYDDLLFKATA
jgi:hypothetical protein